MPLWSACHHATPWRIPSNGGYESGLQVWPLVIDNVQPIMDGTARHGTAYKQPKNKSMKGHAPAEPSNDSIRTFYSKCNISHVASSQASSRARPPNVVSVAFLLSLRSIDRPRLLSHCIRRGPCNTRFWFSRYPFNVGVCLVMCIF